jgi:hypothetical protein
METTLGIATEPLPAQPTNGQAKKKGWPSKAKKPYRLHRATKPQLLTRSQLDGRTNAAKYFDQLASSIETDLGGRDALSTIELALVEAFCGAAVTLNHLNANLALGQKIDFSEHAQAVSAMVKVASRLGLARRSKVISPPSVADYVRHINAKEAGQ